MMHSERRLVAKLIIVFGVVLGTFAATAAQAQVAPPSRESPTFALGAVAFNFLPPGARSLGMGATFVAIADDATAAAANPAGLVILQSSEVSASFRYSPFEALTEDLGAVNAIDFVGPPDATGATSIAALTGSTSAISFVSFVKPFEHFVVSGYYQQSGNFNGETASFLLVDQFFLDDWTSSKRLDYRLDNIGVAVARRIGDWVAIGGAVRYSRLRVNAAQLQQVDYFLDLELVFGIPRESFTDFLADEVSIDDHDSSLTANLGVLVNPNGKVSGGFVYKYGGEFNLTQTTTTVDCLDVPSSVFQFSIPVECDPVARTGDFFFRDERLATVTTSVPDFFGFGVAFRPHDQAVFAVDVNHVTYSKLNPEIGLAPDIFEPIDNATEVHVGFEYTFIVGSQGMPFSVRGGYWNDPDHDGWRQIDSAQDNFTVGAGLVLGRMQVDVAGRFSDYVNELLTSFVFFIGS